MNIAELIGKKMVLQMDLTSDVSDKDRTIFTIEKQAGDEKLCLIWGNGTHNTIHDYTADEITKKLLNTEWLFVATDKQIEWLTELRKNKDLIFSERHIIDKLLHTKPVPYYTIADRDRLNELIHSYK